MQYETVIGLETHVELSTKSKIFCGCSTAFGGEPNTQCCPICTGMPGVLPVLNEKVVEYTVKAVSYTHLYRDRGERQPGDLASGGRDCGYPRAHPRAALGGACYWRATAGND